MILVYNQRDLSLKGRTKRKAVHRRSVPMASWVCASQLSLPFHTSPTHTFWVIKGKEKKLIIFSYFSVVVFLLYRKFNKKLPWIFLIGWLVWWWNSWGQFYVALLMIKYVSLGLPDVEPYFMQPAWWRNLFHVACLIRSHFSWGPSDDGHVLWGLAGDDLCLMKYTWWCAMFHDVCLMKSNVLWVMSHVLWSLPDNEPCFMWLAWW